MDGDNMDGDGTKKYTITKYIDGQPETSNNSRGYTGYGKAVYPLEVEERYEGMYLEGKRNGKGTYYYKNGDIYSGEWMDNEKHGIGTLTYAVEGEYFGRFENGKRHGEGVFTYKKTKDVYSGFWKYGQKSGFGIYTFYDTKLKLSGEWENGSIVSGKWIFPNGIYWEGKFKKNKPNEKGVWHFKEANTVKGDFKQTEDENAEPINDAGEKPILLTWQTAADVYNPEVFEHLNI